MRTTRLSTRFPIMFGLFAILLIAPMSNASAMQTWWQVSAHLAQPSSSLDYTPNGTQPGLAYDLLPSDNCMNCHGPGGSSPPSAPTFLAYPTWGGSMMANATRDPVFWAALDVANHDQPGVGDFCLRCHTPRGWYFGHVFKDGSGGTLDPVQGPAGCLIDGEYDEADNISSDFGGESCHYCHRLMPQGPNQEPPFLENADAWIDDQDCANESGGPCRHGPYDYQVGGSIPPNPPHPWIYSQYHTDSSICGLCHNVSTPDTSAGPLKTLLLNDGTDTGHPFPVERTFDEWQQSTFSTVSGQTCQNCHMPQSEDPGATACSVDGYPNRTGDLPVHAFVGGNTWVPGILKGEYSDTSGIVGSFGGIGRQDSFDQTVGWARQKLQSAANVAATIQSYTPPGASSAGSMAVQVKVSNRSGHKLPTGYAEGRRMWLNLQVHDANGGLVFESAAYDTSSGVLTLDAQARVYEDLQGIWNRNATGACDVADGSNNPIFHFVLNNCIAKDNRIPPLGFQPATAADPNGYDVRPLPAGSYPETVPGSGILVNYDTVAYNLAIPAGTATPLIVNARLYYQTSSRPYMEFLRNEALNNGFSAENTLCTGGPNRPFPIGPQTRTRGEYAYELWNNAPGNTQQPGYGKSPPELMQLSSATTDRIFADGFELAIP